jgi:hypothetical protein
MSDADHEVYSYRPGYITPPLSPTKTDSTEGWFSPKTPGSPRKTRSCLFARTIDNDTDPLSFTPSASSTEPKTLFALHALTIPENVYATSELSPPQSNNDSAVEQDSQTSDSKFLSLSSTTLASSYTPSVPKVHEHRCKDFNPFLTNAPTPVVRLPETQRSFRRSFSDSLLLLSDRKFPITPGITCTVDEDGKCLVPPSLASTNSEKETSSPSKLRQLAARHASSPLRPNQRAANHGLLQSPCRRQSCPPDRFIACRRPPTATRESFELIKLTERQKTGWIGLGTCPNRDPFSQRLSRSERLNNELRDLREVHSMIVGRVGARRRNAALAYRRNSITLGTRQVSAGAVWNVGGLSAVSDTVVGVSTGRGGMLMSGTNAPLYTSTFFNRADPEAELEAYERRLALALGVDQSDRVLQHSQISPISHNAPYNGAMSCLNHIWRDGAWVKDSVTFRWFPST